MPSSQEGGDWHKLLAPRGRGPSSRARPGLLDSLLGLCQVSGCAVCPVGSPARPSHAGKRRVLPAPTDAQPSAHPACGWPWLAVRLIPGGVGTSVPSRPLGWPQMGWGSWAGAASVLLHFFPFASTGLAQKLAAGGQQETLREGVSSPPFHSPGLEQGGRGFQGGECAGESGPSHVSLAAWR